MFMDYAIPAGYNRHIANTNNLVEAAFKVIAHIN
jgi:hypothetical protein